LPDIFNQFGKLFDKGNTTADAGFGDKVATEESDSDITELYLRQIYHPPAKPIPNWADRSQLTLSAFQVDGIGLLRCLDMFGRMTGVGISVDWQSCRIAGIDLSKKIKLNEKEKSIGALVEQVILSQGLEWTLDPSGLPVVFASKAAMEAKLPTDWSIAGLFTEGNEQSGCETLIRLWGLDDVCSFADGRIQWTENAMPLDKANLQASLVELARIRKLDSNRAWSPPTGVAPLFVSTEWNECYTRLSRQVGPTVIVPERRAVPDLLMTAAADVDLDLIIDWQRAWTHGFVPNVVDASVLRNRTMPQVANRFLAEYAMVLVPIDQRTIWITTPDVRRKLIRVIPIRIPVGVKLEDLKQSLRMLAPLGPDELSRFKVTLIPGTENLYFARLCPPLADQLNDPELVQGLGWPSR